MDATKVSRSQGDETNETEVDFIASPQNFSALLFAQRGGQLHAELTEALARLCLAVSETGKEGSLQLTIKVKKVGKGRQMIVSDGLKVKEPRHDVDPSFFFYDSENMALTRNDPYNPEIPGIVALPDRPKNLREV
jgi:hypothetical protein